MPMRPWQNALAIVATFFVAGALLPWNGRIRIFCALVAAALIGLLLVFRLRSHAASVSMRAGAVTDEKIRRIREERKRRMGRRP
ncbi:MAG: hypothetical protein NVSMB64_13450 [Candidatus Velthaea sp.]